MNLTEDGLLRMLDQANARIADQMRPLLGTLDVIQGLQVDIHAAELATLLRDQARKLELQAERMPQGAAGYVEKLKARVGSLRFMSTHLVEGKMYRIDHFTLDGIIGDPNPGSLPGPCY